MAKKANTSKSLIKSPRRSRNVLLTMGNSYKAENNWTVVIATVPLYLNITQEMIDRSIGRSGRYCVVAQAIEALFGKRMYFQVGAGITKIWDLNAKIEVRWHTSGPLAAGIKGFDKPGGSWKLPPNIYKLNPVPRSLKPENARKSREKLQKARKRAAAASKAVGLKVTVFTRRNAARAKPTRTVLRNSRIKLPS